MSWHYPISITHAPSGHPGGIVDRLRLMQESSLTLCPFCEGAFCPLSREATRGEGALRILWRRGLGIRRRCGSRGRTDSKIRRVWFVNGTAIPQKGILRRLEREVVRDESLCQGLNDRRHANDLWRLGELVASTEINM